MAVTDTKLCENVAVAALRACAAIVCGSPANQTNLSLVKTVIPWGPKRMVSSVGGLAQVVQICVDTTRRRSSPAIRSAACGLLDAYLCLNESGAISFVGHAIAPPPADLNSSQGLGIPKSQPAGRIVVQQVISSLRQIAELLNTPDSGGMSAENAAEVMVSASSNLEASCDILECICFDNATC